MHKGEHTVDLIANSRVHGARPSADDHGFVLPAVTSGSSLVERFGSRSHLLHHCRSAERPLPLCVFLAPAAAAAAGAAAATPSIDVSGVPMKAFDDSNNGPESHIVASTQESHRCRNSCP